MLTVSNQLYHALSKGMYRIRLFIFGVTTQKINKRQNVR